MVVDSRSNRQKTSFQIIKTAVFSLHRKVKLRETFVAAANFTQHSALLEDFTITKHIPTVIIPYQNGSCKDKD